jgi:hypothetical protein
VAGEFEVRIEIEGLDALKKKLKSSTAAGPARKFLTRSGNEIIAKAKPLTTFNTGTLRRSIDKEVAGDTPIPTFVKVGTNVKYAPFVEFGRGPGKMPPREPIEYWYRRKNKAGPTQDVASALYAIQRAIGRRGVKARPYLVPGFEQAVPMIQRHVYTFADELEEAYKRGSS